MRLVIAKGGETEKQPSVKKAAFLLLPSSKEATKALSKSGKSSGAALFPYIIDSGEIGAQAVISKTPPNGTDLQTFLMSSDLHYKLFKADQELLADRAHLVAETLKLRGNRINPTRLYVKKIKPFKDSELLYVEGELEGVFDPRLDFIEDSESTAFGQGTFNHQDLRANYAGDYVYLNPSPWADDIRRIAEQQRTLFNEFREATSEEEQTRLLSEMEKTCKLLKPHAHQIYAFDNDHVYYVNGDGRWSATPYMGLRNLDLDDYIRVKDSVDVEDDEILAGRHELHNIPVTARFKLHNISSVLAPFIKRSKTTIEQQQAHRARNFLKLKPTDGPLAASDLPGVKAHVKFMPHQSYVLGMLKNVNRQLVDADPGAGKTLMIICDAIQQMKQGKMKRPLVVMPDYLLSQFAKEIVSFTEYNPWIISNTSVEKWVAQRHAQFKNATKEEKLALFLNDAAKSPPNTIFLTSYLWLSQETEAIETGELQSVVDPETGKTLHNYQLSTYYPNPNKLLANLGADGVFFDEVHALKNNSHQASAATVLASAPMVRGFTGTIMPGNLIDVTGPMGAIHSGVFGASGEFLQKYSPNGTPELYHDSAPKDIRSKLAAVGVPQIRRSAWQHLLPHGQEHYHFVKFTPTQQKVYDAILTNIMDDIRKDPKMQNALAKLENSIKDGEGEQLDAVDALEAKGSVLSRFIPLDIFVNDPPQAKKWPVELLEASDAISPKAKIIADICHKHLSNPNNGKILIFVQFSKSGKALLNALPPDLQEIAAYYEAGMADVLHRLQNPSDPLQIVIGIDKSLRTGHNIQSVNCVIHADLLWLNGEMQQREARSLRVGQTRNVDIHYIITKGSAEVLKLARLISAEHMTTKANSNFDDKTTLQPVTMTVGAMQSFREEEQVKPFIERKKEIKRQYLETANTEKSFYGEKTLERHGSEPVTSLFKEAKVLRRVPSSKDFSGDLREPEQLVTQELEKLPREPVHPRVLEFHVREFDSSWALVCYYSSDPQGFLRRLKFNLCRTRWSVGVGSKAGALAMIEKIENKKLLILNKDKLLSSIQDARVTAPGQKNVVQQTERMSRQRTKKNISAAADDIGEVSLKFGLFDGAPLLYVDTMDESDAELKVLQGLGFKAEPPYWSYTITRSNLTQLLTRIQQNFIDLRFTNWARFKQQISQAFRGFDISDFDDLAVPDERLGL